MTEQNQVATEPQSKPKSMEDWIKDPVDCPDEVCCPCTLGPVVQWYDDELREKGEIDKAERLLAALETIQPEELCQELDKIKEDVPEELRTRLQDFDMSAQAYAKSLKEGGLDEQED